MFTGFMNSLLRDNKSTKVSLRLLEVRSWKYAKEIINRLTNVHKLDLALHFPEGSKICRQIFDILHSEEMKGKNGWVSVIALLEIYCPKG